MKRKETLLEQNLIYKGYRLEGKSYTGKKSDKVFAYNYVKDNGVVKYYVQLDKTRNTIKYHYFTTDRYYLYDQGKLEGLQEVLSSFTSELMSIYDFQNHKARDLPVFSELEEDLINHEDYIEESVFDD
jgi:hypothetical protein